MALNYVTLTGTLPAAAGAVAAFAASNWLTDPTDALLVPPVPAPAGLTATTVGGVPCGTFSIPLLATDNANLPAGWYWTVTFASLPPGTPAESFSFFLAHASGATQDISGLATIPAPVPITPYLPVPSGTPAAGSAPLATGTGQASAWTQLGTLQKVATTGNNGYTLVNGTGNIITWTAPSDGNMHRVLLFAELNVTSALTGGQISLSHNLPNGTAYNPQIIAANQGSGAKNIGNPVYLVQPGSLVALQQNSAISAGAGVLWAELWAQ
jgi:hypothetical protein